MARFTVKYNARGGRKKYRGRAARKGRRAKKGGFKKGVARVVNAMSETKLWKSTLANSLVDIQHDRMWYWSPVGNIALGSGANQRVGRKITITNIQFEMSFGPDQRVWPAVVLDIHYHIFCFWRGSKANVLLDDVQLAAVPTIDASSQYLDVMMEPTIRNRGGLFRLTPEVSGVTPVYYKHVLHRAANSMIAVADVVPYVAYGGAMPIKFNIKCNKTVEWTQTGASVATLLNGFTICMYTSVFGGAAGGGTLFTGAPCYLRIKYKDL